MHITVDIFPGKIKVTIDRWDDNEKVNVCVVKEFVQSETTTKQAVRETLEELQVVIETAHNSIVPAKSIPEDNSPKA